MLPGVAGGRSSGCIAGDTLRRSGRRTPGSGRSRQGPGRLDGPGRCPGRTEEGVAGVGVGAEGGGAGRGVRHGHGLAAGGGSPGPCRGRGRRGFRGAAGSGGGGGAGRGGGRGLGPLPARGEPAGARRMRHRHRAAGLRRSGRRDHRTAPEPAPGLRPGRGTAGRAGVQPGRAGRQRHGLPALSAVRLRPAVARPQPGLRLRGFRAARRRPLRAAVLPGPGGVHPRPQPGPGGAVLRVQAGDEPQGGGVRGRVPRQPGRPAGALLDPGRRPRSACHPRRPGRAAAHLSRRLLRHLPGLRLRHPVPRLGPPDGAGLRGQPRPLADLVPQQSAPVPGLRVPLAGLEGVGGRPSRGVRPGRERRRGAAGLRRRPGGTGPGAAGRHRGPQGTAQHLPRRGLHRAAVARAGRGAGRVPGGRQRAAAPAGPPGDRPGGRRRGERERRLHGRGVQ